MKYRACRMIQQQGQEANAFADANRPVAPQDTGGGA
jgi:hypothetical protein